eukprot:GILK01006065.1.p1 GENE.GILK01006065.1~~GILK01006065.1.p1  ORF type:complete len:455 (-),score=64.98 GILK01006065.1:109-1473(-)
MKAFEAAYLLPSLSVCLLSLFGHHYEFAWLLGLLGCALQVVQSGPRWQLHPAYLATAAEVLCVVSGIKVPFFVLVLCFIAFLVSSVLAFLLPVPKFPKVTGPFRVGYKEFFLSGKINGMTLQNNACVWYPADVPKGSKYVKAKWLVDGHLTGQGYASYGKVPLFLFNHLIDVRMRAYLNAPLSSESLDFVPLVFSHGMGGMRTAYTSICQELASYGYIVFVTEHNDGSAGVTRLPDGTVKFYTPPASADTAEQKVFRNAQVKQRVAEVRLLLQYMDDCNRKGSSSEFSGKLQMDKVSIVGHSFGAATAIEAAFDEPRFNTCTAMDPWLFPISSKVMEEGLSVPLLVINTDRFHWPTNLEALHRLQDNCKKDVRSIRIKDTHHMNQGDMAIFVERLLKLVKGVGPMRSDRALRANTDAILSFLRKELHRDASAVLREDLTVYGDDLVFEDKWVKA